MCYFVNRWVCSQESAISHFGVLAQRRCRLHISQRRWKNTLIDSTWSLFVSLIYFILFLPVSLPSGPDPRRSAHPRLLSLRVPPLSFWFCPSSPAQDLDPDQHGRVPTGWGLCQLPSAQLCQRASLQVTRSRRSVDATFSNLSRNVQWCRNSRQTHVRQHNQWKMSFLINPAQLSCNVAESEKNEVEVPVFCGCLPSKRKKKKNLCPADEILWDP